MNCDRCNNKLKNTYVEAVEIGSNEVYVFCDYECYEGFVYISDLDGCIITMIDIEEE